MVEKVLRTYGDQTRKESIAKGKVSKKIVFPKWFPKRKK